MVGFAYGVIEEIVWLGVGLRDGFVKEMRRQWQFCELERKIGILVDLQLGRPLCL